MSKRHAPSLFIPIHRIVKAMADTKLGPFADAAIINEIVKFMHDNPADRDVVKEARTAYKQYLRRVRPRLASLDGVYHPERVVPAAPRMHMIMRDVGPDQFEFWRQHDETAWSSAETAHSFKRGYWATRQRAFAEGDFKKLDAVERMIFGYRDKPTSTLPPELLDGDDDDDEE